MQVSPHLEGKEVPGKDRWKFFHIAELVLHGQQYFYKRRDKHKSSVFKINMGVTGITICDRKGINVFFDTDKIYKEPCFGRLNYNLSLLDGYVPSMFTNGVPHEKQKAFLMQICKIAQESTILATTIQFVKGYCRKWQNADADLKSSFELSIMDLTSDIFTWSFFGVRVDTTCMYKFLKGSWAKGSALRAAMESAYHLKKAFRESTEMAEILRTASEAGVSEDQALMDVLFMLNFNSYGGVSGSLRSCIAHLYILEEDNKKKMKNEITTVLSKQELSDQAFSEMPLLHNFVLEVLRMHPPVPVFFGRAREAFILDSDSGKFIVRKNQLLVGNVHMVHRDDTIFDQPDQFMPSRFEDETLVDHVLFGNGPFYQEATPQNHRCPGQDITLTVLKTVVSHFLLYCDFALASCPKWTGKKLRRVGCPDKQMKLSYFKYNNSEVDGKEVGFPRDSGEQEDTVRHRKTSRLNCFGSS